MTPYRFVFATWQGGGNVPPALALVKRLARRGHAVRLLGPPSLAAKAADDYAFVGGESVPERQRQPGLLVGEQLEECTRYLCGPEWHDAVASELEREPADVFVCDHPARECAGRRSGVLHADRADLRVPLPGLVPRVGRLRPRRRVHLGRSGASRADAGHDPMFQDGSDRAVKALEALAERA